MAVSNSLERCLQEELDRGMGAAWRSTPCPGGRRLDSAALTDSGSLSRSALVRLASALSVFPSELFVTFTKQVIRSLPGRRVDSMRRTET